MADRRGEELAWPGEWPRGFLWARPFAVTFLRRGRMLAGCPGLMPAPHSPLLAIDGGSDAMVSARRIKSN